MIVLRKLLLLIAFLPNLAFSAPRVVVTLKPIHSLAAKVMENVGTPELLLPDGASPHTYQMKPSTLKQLNEADMIIWVGPSLETFMQKSMNYIHPPQVLLTLSRVKDLKTWPQRQGREWHDHHHHDHDHNNEIDPHLWLSTENAGIIIEAISNALSQKDPSNAARYQANAQQAKTELAALQTRLQAQLNAVHEVPFLVYHDGYQYFEKKFNLNAKGTLLANPHLPLSAYGLKKIKEQIQSQHIQCVFRETEFSDKLIQDNLKDLNVRIIELDPLGIHFPAGPHHYFQTMEALGNDLQTCLKPK
jgi:zinc transport system substrate-binding protein